MGLASHVHQPTHESHYSMACSWSVAPATSPPAICVTSSAYAQGQAHMRKGKHTCARVGFSVLVFANFWVFRVSDILFGSSWVFSSIFNPKTIGNSAFERSWGTWNNFQRSESKNIGRFAALSDKKKPRQQSWSKSRRNSLPLTPSVRHLKVNNHC